MCQFWQNRRPWGFPLPIKMNDPAGNFRLKKWEKEGWNRENPAITTVIWLAIYTCPQKFPAALFYPSPPRPPRNKASILNVGKDVSSRPLMFRRPSLRLTPLWLCNYVLHNSYLVKKFTPKIASSNLLFRYSTFLPNSLE